MFEDYAKRIENMGANAPKIFKTVALWGAKQAVNEAKEITDRYNKVDTGNYRLNWFAERIEPEKNVYGVQLENPVEYASFIEEGYKLKNGGRMPGFFIGRQALDNTEARIIMKLRDEIEILMLQKNYGLSRKEARKFI